MELTGTHPFTHDLVELLQALKALGLEPPPELYVYADALTPHYTMARYPGRRAFRYDRSAGERCVTYAGRIIAWVLEAAEGTGEGQKEPG